MLMDRAAVRHTNSFLASNMDADVTHRTRREAFCGHERFFFGKVAAVIFLLALPILAAAAGSTDRYTYDAAGNIVAIKSVAADALNFSGFSPGEAPFGVQVTLSGSGFSLVTTENKVSFNGTLASVVSATIDTLVVTVPTNARTGRISVTVGSAIVTNPTIFIVDTSAEAPTIASFSPSIAAIGDSVTLTGTNYDPVGTNDVLVFNSTDMSIGSVNPTHMSATIPTALSSGKITVTTIYGSATSATDLIVVPSGATAADIGSTVRTAIDAIPISFSVPAGKIGMVLFDGMQGQNVSLGVTSLVTTPSSSAMSVSLIAPNGSILANCNNEAPPSFSCYLPLLPSTGTYTLVFKPASLAAATFNVTLSNDIVSTLTPSVRTLTFARAAQEQRLSLNVAQGSALTIEIAGIALSPANAVLTTKIIHPAGFVVQQATSNAAGGLVLHVPNVTFGGMYTLLVQSNNGATGTAQLTLDAGTALAVDGPTVNIATTSLGQAVSLNFSATAGQNVGLVVNGLGLSPSFQFVALVLYNPDGSINHSLDSYPYCQSPATAGCRWNLIGLPLTGTYTLLMMPGSTPSTPTPTDASTISAAITVSSDIHQTLTTGVPAPVNFTRPGQSARLSFAVTSGVPITIEVSGIVTTPSGYGLSATILDSSGAVLQQSSNTAGGILLHIPVPSATGTYTLLLQPSGSATGSAQVLLDAGSTLRKR